MSKGKNYFMIGFETKYHEAWQPIKYLPYLSAINSYFDFDYVHTYLLVR